MASVVNLAGELVLGAVLERLGREHGGWELVDHWQQGEFHHDLVVRVREPLELGAAFVVVATNCNGGVKEVLVFDDVPDRFALWHYRCPANPAFSGTLPAIKGHAATEHWFDPCVLLAPDARSELRPEHRVQQAGGGWCKR